MLFSWSWLCDLRLNRNLHLSKFRDFIIHRCQGSGQIDNFRRNSYQGKSNKRKIITIVVMIHVCFIDMCHQAIFLNELHISRDTEHGALLHGRASLLSKQIYFCEKHSAKTSWPFFAPEYLQRNCVWFLPNDLQTIADFFFFKLWFFSNIFFKKSRNWKIKSEFFKKK